MCKKILVIGSGPIVIGQAAEFDYAGTQACQALKEEGYSVVLVNSNPATIMTDSTIADQIYMEPLTSEFLKKVIQKEKPDALLPTLGGQTALNLAVELANSGVLDKFQTKIIGTSLETIEKCENREQFRTLMQQLQIPVPESENVYSVEQGIQFANQVGYPIIVRPAYTLGGTGGGICQNEEELKSIVRNGLNQSPVQQCLLEESIAGFKEIEFEVVRDKENQIVVVCTLENIDPVGVHTGDSIVVSPPQTLQQEECKMLRHVAIKVVQALDIEGACNVQLALHPNGKDYYMIEVNPRVSRSSALASKATHYPIAKVAGKIAVGKKLHQISNPILKGGTMLEEPILDYVVTKFPCFPFDKFPTGNRTLGTQMKATGEILAIGSNFKEAFLKGVRSWTYTEELWLKSLSEHTTEQLMNRLDSIDDERMFVIAELLRRHVLVDEIYEHTKIERYFLRQIRALIKTEIALQKHPFSMSTLMEAKVSGFSDRSIARIWKTTEEEVFNLRLTNNLIPHYKEMAVTATNRNYFSTYEKVKDKKPNCRKKVIVLGSGPIQIGQGIEFDYATVHSVIALQELGYEAIIMNHNPETVSTDYTISDKLYVEPLTIENVMHVVTHEKPIGVIVAFGGQTSLNLAKGLKERGVNLIGTDLDAIDQVEDREKFDCLLEQLKLNRPRGKTVNKLTQAKDIANELGYPVVVRPSYVIGGSMMEIIYDEPQLERYLTKTKGIQHDSPILIDKYMIGIELEVDAICDGEATLIPGFIEHIERTGVHSGDSIAVYPPQIISKQVKETCRIVTEKIAQALQLKGLLNIQFIIQGEEVFILEVNPRSSRTVPFMSKVTGVNMANIATKCMLGMTLAELGYEAGVLHERSEVAIKMPVFSFEKLQEVDIVLGPEMKSTGEVIGFDKTFEKALYKGFLASGLAIQQEGGILLTVANRDKQHVIQIAKRFYNLGFTLYATAGTAATIRKALIPVNQVEKVGSNDQNVLSIIETGEIQIVLNTMTAQKQQQTDGYFIRRKTIEHQLPCFTSMATIEAFLRVIESMHVNVNPMFKKEVVQS